MKPSRQTSIQRKLIIYFLLIGFASLLVTVEFFFDMQKNELKDLLMENFIQFSRHQIDISALFAPLDHLTKKVIVIIGVILFETVIVLTMFLKNIVGPLKQMIDVSREIKNGDLSKNISIHSNNELAVLGEVINDMSRDLQESIQFIQNMIRSRNKMMERLLPVLDTGAPLAADLTFLESEIRQMQSESELLQAFVDNYQFYEIKDGVHG